MPEFQSLHVRDVVWGWCTEIQHFWHFTVNSHP